MWSKDSFLSRLHDMMQTPAFNQRPFHQAMESLVQRDNHYTIGARRLVKITSPVSVTPTSLKQDGFLNRHFVSNKVDTRYPGGNIVSSIRRAILPLRYRTLVWIDVIQVETVRKQKR